MAKSTLDTIDDLLEASIAETGDTEVHYKLRSARQLLSVVEDRRESLDELVEESVEDEALLDNLRDLGYLE
ncbi:Uncharacterized protein HSRCO_2051 [Halanaeroarchaeum sp. HSR-CO]|uniref:hypothetical protein n=1 Tax=Halanaeroarchaeum sp. HSR-CO TaxID=2866382 RepID=UPI00217E6A40|nr:hypothetical protein [Halanaeroarchaeum sp. HSR-CO]UWG48325.1 Uncharacterized protein HSRCO_2051 [Halanaeroarchaeum sp. HSR-CO]